MQLVIKWAMLSSLAFLPGLQGCATIMHGTRQPVELTSDGAEFEVSLDGGPVQKTPLILNLARKQDHVLKVKSLETGESGLIEIRRMTNHWIWANFCTGLYGVIGLGADYLMGGAYRLKVTSGSPDENPWPGGIPYEMQMSWDVDPWRTGEWHGSFAYNTGLRLIPDTDSHPSGGVEPEFGFNLVLGKNEWPVDLVVDGYFYSSALALGNWEVARAGLRKSLLKNFSRARPYFSAGLSFLAESTQPGGGLPLGFWGRAGVDIRTGRRIFLGPYVGYSKYELTTAGENTGGPLGGLMLGILW